ncbi:helix-turn-helix domain-containing protein [Citrobacter freundii]|nr:helix-turn-helix transcriptional regulator [Citrobacter freundii]
MHLKYNISNVNARIGRFVRSNRQKMNMSAEELAVELNICQQHVSRFERGQCAFTLEFILRNLNVFNIRLSHLVSEVFYEDTQVFSKARSIIQNNSMTKTIN